MPSSFASRAPVALYIAVLFVSRQIRLIVLARIEADRYNVKILSSVERDTLQRSRQSVQYLVTKHRALVINESQDHWPAALEILAKIHLSAALVFELKVKR